MAALENPCIVHTYRDHSVNACMHHNLLGIYCMAMAVCGTGRSTSRIRCTVTVQHACRMVDGRGSKIVDRPRGACAPYGRRGLGALYSIAARRALTSVQRLKQLLVCASSRTCCRWACEAASLPGAMGSAAGRTLHWQLAVQKS